MGWVGVTSLQPDPALELDVTLELGHLLFFQYGILMLGAGA